MMRLDPVSQVQEHYQRRLTKATETIAEVGRERNALRKAVTILRAAMIRDQLPYGLECRWCDWFWYRGTPERHEEGCPVVDADNLLGESQA